jgi:hypothetical protein
LAAWWTVLEHTGTDWRQITTRLFGDFLAYLRTGDLPGTARIGEPGVWCAPSTVQQRAAAVMSFYRYHAAAHRLDEPYQRLHTTLGKRGRPFAGFEHNVGGAGEVHPGVVRVRGAGDGHPVVEPDEAHLDARR